MTGSGAAGVRSPHDPGAAVPQTWPAFIWGLLRKPLLLCAILLLIVLLYVALWSIGADPLGISPYLVQVANTLRSFGNLHDAVALQRPYVLDTVLMQVVVCDSPAPGSNLRTAVRTNYSIRALRDISVTESVFPETYSSNSASRVQVWSGSEIERMHTTVDPVKKYQVQFELKAGARRTIVTGADFYHALRDTSIDAFGGTMLIPPSQDFEAYPNDEDLISEFIMYVESGMLGKRVRRIDRAAIRLTTNGNVQRQDLETWPQKHNPSAVDGALVARWYNVLPGEHVGIIWEYEDK